MLIDHQSLKRKRFRMPMDFVTRRTPRYVCGFDTVIRTKDDPNFSVRVLNFSEEGFLLASVPAVSSGARFEILLPGLGYRSARALWMQGSKFGGKFEVPVDVDELMSALEDKGLISAG